MRKGFTLIELLAVIVILAIIALIAVPIVLGIIDDAKKSSVVRSGEFYIKGLELAIANSALTPDTGEVKDGEYNIINGNVCLGTIAGTGENRTCNGELLEVEINGEVPSEGLVAISNGQVAYVEGLKIGNTKISSSVEGLTESENRVVCEAVTEKTRLKDKHYAFDSIDTNYNTVLETKLSYIGNIPEGKYEPGDEYFCEVKPGTIYRFYVLGTDGDNVKLIMNQNITSKGTPATSTDNGTVEWISDEDYGCGTNGTNCAKSDKGPVTAMNFLNNATSAWINIQIQKFNLNIQSLLVFGELELGNKEINYGLPETKYSLTINSRTRMIMIEEAFGAGCRFELNPAAGGKYYINACPLWLSNNLQFRDNESLMGNRTDLSSIANGPRGYWIMNHNTSSNSTNIAFEIYDHINLNSTYVYRTNYNGVRPVITINKENIK